MNDETNVEHIAPASLRVSDKSTGGRHFEDFALGETILHATPRTVTAGDVSLYTALTGSRFALQSSDAFAQSVGLPQAPHRASVACPGPYPAGRSCGYRRSRRPGTPHRCCR